MDQKEIVENSLKKTVIVIILAAFGFGLFFLVLGMWQKENELVYVFYAYQHLFVCYRCRRADI